MSPALETAVIGLLMAGVPTLTAIGIYFKVRSKKNGNGNGSSASTLRLQTLEDDRFRELKEETETLRSEMVKELYARDGAVRAGDHGIRNDVQEILLKAEVRTAGQYGELKESVEKLRENVAGLTLAVAKHGGHCSHCPGGGA